MDTVETTGAPAPDATVLGRLLVIQQAVDAMPDEVHIAAFVGRALVSLPGVDDAHVDLEGHTAPPVGYMAGLKTRCERDASPVPVLNFMRHLGSGVQCFPIDAPGQRFGWLLLKVRDEEALRPYVAFIGNIAGALGRILVARHYQARLARANEALRDARDGLEMRVAERTRELEYRATHDQLTGLSNRALLIDRLLGAISTAQREGRMVAVVYLDLDSFTFINTGLGNACGDEFLRETARRLARLVRDGDTVARIGSDEFVILLGGLDSAERSSARLNAMLAAVRQPVPLAGKDAVVTCSIGAAIYPLDGDEAEILLRRANSAMSAGQEQRQGQHPAVREHARRRRRRAHRTRDRAAAGGPGRRAGVALPAQARTGHGRVRRRRGAGALGPSAARPAAAGRVHPAGRGSSLIVALGERVLLQACQQAPTWREAGLRRSRPWR